MKNTVLLIILWGLLAAVCGFGVGFALSGILDDEPPNETPIVDCCQEEVKRIEEQLAACRQNLETATDGWKDCMARSEVWRELAIERVGEKLKVKR